MSARYWELESSADNWALEDGTGARLLEDATLTTVSQLFTFLYDITAVVSKAFTFLYDITAQVSQAFTHIYDINGSASSVLQSQTGTVTLTALNSEICFVTKTDGPWHYACHIFLDNMVSGDEIAIKVQVYDTVSGTWKSYDNEKKINYRDIASDTDAFIPFLPATRYRVCIKQTAGTLRSFNWQLFKT